ncbi:MAG: hypothetical protein AABY34_01140 [Pseudomonadota bacterium]
MNPTLKKILIGLGILGAAIIVVAALALGHVITLPAAIFSASALKFSLATGSTIGTSILGYWTATKTSIVAWLKKAILGEPESPAQSASVEKTPPPQQQPAVVINLGQQVGLAAAGSAEAEIARQEERIKVLEAQLEKSQADLAAEQAAKAQMEAELAQLIHDRDSTASRLYTYYLSVSQQNYQDIQNRFNESIADILRLSQLEKKAVIEKISLHFPGETNTLETRASSLPKKTIPLTANLVTARTSIIQLERDAAFMHLETITDAKKITTNELLRREKSWSDVIAKYSTNIYNFLANLIRATDKSERKGDSIIRAQVEALHKKREMPADMGAATIASTPAGAAFFSPAR